MLALVVVVVVVVVVMKVEVEVVQQQQLRNLVSCRRTRAPTISLQQRPLPRPMRAIRRGQSAHRPRQAPKPTLSRQSPPRLPPCSRSRFRFLLPLNLPRHPPPPPPTTFLLHPLQIHRRRWPRRPCSPPHQTVPLLLCITSHLLSRQRTWPKSRGIPMMRTTIPVV